MLVSFRWNALWISSVDPFITDLFISLNAVRVLSIVALLLVFSSNIVTLVNDIKAVNRFMEAGKVIAAGAGQRNATANALSEFDYIPYVFFSSCL